MLWYTYFISGKYLTYVTNEHVSVNPTKQFLQHWIELLTFLQKVKLNIFSKIMFNTKNLSENNRNFVRICGM